ncbi:cell cycle checkpoint control protein RAD9A [Atheta coriaria]|uniref:cell cycle checkpoint control protein RAD9A n=1 Tax=Dalotia coriaria TaxID=877792 RepID=UPI0031F3D624
MFCSIPGGNIKVVNKSIETLSKLSDEVHIECTETSLIFAAHNVTKTSYAKYTFYASFFLHYECNTEPNKPMACKITNRALMMIFKRKMEKKIESCKINLKYGDDSIVFQLRYKSGITTTHTYYLLNWEHTVWGCDSDPNSNKIICKSALLLHVLSNFKAKDTHLYVDANEDNIILRNYGENENNLKIVHSQIKLHKGEFRSYDVRHKCSFMIPVRALRSVISYADVLALHILLSFTKGVNPLIISVEQENCNGYCVISALPLDGTQSTNSLQITPSSTYISLQRSVDSQENNMEVDTVEDSIGSNQDGRNRLLAQLTINENQSLAHMEPHFEAELDNSRVIRPEVLHIFGRCFDPTFHASQVDVGKVLCENSDTDSD